MNDNANGPKPESRPSGTDGITVTSFREFTLHIKDDGHDYAGLFQKLMDGEYPKNMLVFEDEGHWVSTVEFEGRKFVYKRIDENRGRPDTRLWWYVFGPFHRMAMKQTRRAIDSGCDILQDIYLVAEIMRDRLSYDNYILSEYVEGICLDKMENDVPEYKKELAEGFIKLHSYGMALSNVKTGNIVLVDGAMKFIDLSNRGSLLVGRAKDAIRSRLLWGVVIPSYGLADRVARATVWIRIWFKKFKARLRGEKRDKLF